MSTYKAPLDDLRFALYDVLGAEALFARLGHVDANRELVDAVIDEAARFSDGSDHHAVWADVVAD